ncbi:hypothetical protein TIFTF001_053092 [Ficus carica]|uniref:Uncharacterized protein n=1 Tax=Ficus carica TaxID=3494 RepID=A0AA88EFN8_FICCA|nr:hypothetical protein TIFTF001_053092 [Ficus carica]
MVGGGKRSSSASERGGARRRRVCQRHKHEGSLPVGYCNHHEHVEIVVVVMSSNKSSSSRARTDPRCFTTQLLLVDRRPSSFTKRRHRRWECYAFNRNNIA